MSLTPTRRRFIELAPLAGTALVAACSPPPPPPAPVTTAPAPTPTPAPPPAVSASDAAPAATVMLDEKDTQAVALGYVSEAARADTTRFKNYVAGSQCSGCTLYLGKPGDASGPCSIFQGKGVAAGGWCSAFVKKA